MYIERILQQKLAVNQTFNPGTQTENKHEYAQQEGLSVSDLAIAISPVSFIFVWVIFLLILQKLRSNLENKLDFTIHNSHQVPCKNCNFFANNHYLKCAVKPDIVLTEAAINCSEYCPKKGKFSGNKIFR